MMPDQPGSSRAGEQPSAPEGDPPGTTAPLSSRKPSPAQVLPLFAPSGSPSTSQQPAVAAPHHHQQQQKPQVTPASSSALQVPTLSPSKRSRDDIRSPAEEPVSGPVIGAASPQHPLMSHPLGDLTQPAYHPALKCVKAAAELSQELPMQWPPISAPVAQPGASPQGGDHRTPSSGLLSLMQPSGNLEAAVQVAHSVSTAVTAASTSEQRKQDDVRHQTALNVDRALLNHLQLLAPPGAALPSPVPHAPVAHLPTATLRRHSAFVDPSAPLMPAVSGGNSSAAMPWLQQPQPGAHSAAQLGSRTPAVPPCAQPPHTAVVSGASPRGSAVHTPTPVSVASQGQCQQGQSVSVSHPPTQPPFQAGAVPLPEGQVPQQLYMRLQDQVMSYMAAISGMQHTPMPLAPAGEQPTSQQQSALNAQHAQLAEIEQRALQAGVEEAQRQAHAMVQQNWGFLTSGIGLTLPPAPQLQCRPASSTAALAAGSAGPVAAAPPRPATGANPQQQPVTVLSAPVALSLVGQSLHSSLPMPPNAETPPTLPATVSAPTPFPAHLPSAAHAHQSVPQGQPPHGAPGSLAMHAAPQLLQSGDATASRSHPSHTSTSTTESLRQPGALPLTASVPNTSAQPAHSAPHVPNPFLNMQSMMGATIDTTGGVVPRSVASAAAQIAGSTGGANAPQAHELQALLQNLPRPSMPASAATAVGGAAPAAAAAPGPVHSGATRPVPARLMNQFTGGSTPAQQDSAARTPNTRAVNALLALQKQLDTVQDRLSNEQKKSESRLDGLLQNMRSEADGADPETAKHLASVHQALLKATSITARQAQQPGADPRAAVQAPQLPAQPPVDAPALKSERADTAGAAGLHTPSTITNTRSVGQPQQQGPQGPAAAAPQAYTSASIRAAAATAAAAVDPAWALDALTRASDGGSPAGRCPQPPAPLQPASAAVASAAPVPEAESAAAVQQEGMTGRDATESSDAIIAQAATATRAVTGHAATGADASESEQNRWKAGAGVPAQGSDNAAESGSAVCVQNGADPSRSAARPASAMPVEAPVPGAKVSADVDAGGEAAAAGGLDHGGEGGEGLGIGSGKQASLDTKASAGKSGEPPFVSTCSELTRPHNL